MSSHCSQAWLAPSHCSQGGRPAGSPRWLWPKPRPAVGLPSASCTLEFAKKNNRIPLWRGRTLCRFLAPPARLRSIADSEACCRAHITKTSHTDLFRSGRTGRVVAPASTPMAAQAPELPAGREPMSERWCYFCGRRGKPTRGSSRGRKRVAFVRCGHTQPGRGRGATAHDGMQWSLCVRGGAVSSL